MTSERVLSRSVALRDVHGGVDVEITADPAQRAALAKAYDLLAVGDLTANVTVRGDSSGYEVSGRVAAHIEQACVVSLAPVAQHIDELFAVRFVPPDSPEVAPAKPHSEIVVDPAAPDPPEVLTGNSIDIGAVVEEAFVLAIDPYPRAPGAVLVEPLADQDQPTSPFAVLGGLKGHRS
jgi:uncharacterized metal-binding protein YceD (DUF177 family)